MNTSEKPGSSKETFNGNDTDGLENESFDNDTNNPPSSGKTDPKKGRDPKKEVDLIDVVNDLQNKLAACGQPPININLPQIVVVGSQSAGKSSVLESFVGKEFLPRGTDTVTRRPTVVQMIPSPNEEYVIFSHKPEVKFTDFQKVKEEIESETRRHPGPVGFSDQPINLKIYSPRVLKLTVVDLPGLIKDVEDNQSHTSVQTVHDMVLKFITPEESLILAVTPANQEIVTSDAMSIAKKADPKRLRTIGVLTKMDLSSGTDVRAVLENRKIYLARGYVGVVNRSQAEIEEKKDFKHILQREKEFFENSQNYRHLKNIMGTPYLVKVLQKSLRSHIKRFLPQVRSDVAQKLADNKKKLREFNKSMGEGIKNHHPVNQHYYIIKLIKTFMEDVKIQVMGNSEEINTDEFSPGAIIQYKFASEVHRNLTLKIIPDTDQAQIIIVNQQGFKLSISIPDRAFDSLNRMLLKQYKGPMKESVECIKKVLKYAIMQSSKILDRYPALKSEIVFLINDIIDQEADNTVEKLIDHIDANMYYINYYHPDFDHAVCSSIAPNIGPIKLWEMSTPEDQSSEVQDSDENRNSDVEYNLPKKDKMLHFLKQNESNQNNLKYSTTLLLKCIENVQKQMPDVALKYISFFLIKKLLDFVSNELTAVLVGSPNYSKLTEDCEADFRWKEEIETTCKLLEEVEMAIREF